MQAPYLITQHYSLHSMRSELLCASLMLMCIHRKLFCARLVTQLTNSLLRLTVT